jgi:hypothetical protein
MVAGLFSKAGCFMGENLHPAMDSNPKGFYEAPEINGINEEIIRTSGTKDESLRGRWFSSYHPQGGQRWLARLSPRSRVHSTQSIDDRIINLVKKTPFCFKDPRFCYTLPVWRPYLKDTVFICVFRDPVSTANSILKECAAREYLHALKINYDIAQEVWMLMYQQVISKHRQAGDWLFVHYDQVISGEALEKISRLTSSRLDSAFPDRSLRRSYPDRKASVKATRIYFALCRLAQYSRGEF